MKQHIYTYFSVLCLSASSIIAYDKACCYDPWQEDCCNNYMYGEFVYWYTCRSGLDYVIETDNPASTSLPNPGKILRPDNGWNSGFRVGFGQRCIDDKDIAFRYTYYQNTTADTRTFEDNHSGGATRLHPDISALADNPNLPNLNQAKMESYLGLNLVDIEIGAWSPKSFCLMIRPFGALRLSWIQHKLLTGYPENIETPTRTTEIKQKINMQAYGVVTGADGRYLICDSFYLAGRVSLGGLYGIFDRSSIEGEKDLTTPGAQLDTLLNVFDRECKAVLSTEASLGIEAVLGELSGSEILFSLGYELHTWQDLVDFLDFPSGTLTSKMMRDNSSLMFHGVYARLSASF